MARTVLIVEDEPELASLLTDILESEGDVAVTTAPGGAVEATRSLHPDVIIMDYTMPGMTGAEVAAEIRQTFGDGAPPIVLVTGHANAEILAAQAGVQAYLRKPFDLDTFLDLIRRTAQTNER